MIFSRMILYRNQSAHGELSTDNGEILQSPKIQTMTMCFILMTWDQFAVIAAQHSDQNLQADVIDLSCSVRQ